MNNNNAVFQSFRSPDCDTFFNRTIILERHLTTCSEREKNVCPKNVYQTQKTLFDKLNCFGIEYTYEQNFLKNLVIFDFESICVQEESFKDTNTTKWMGEQVPISVSVSSSLVKEPVCICNSNPHHLVTSFICALENIALQSKAKIKRLFFDNETTIKKNWTAAWRNLPNVIIEESKQIWIIAITKIVPALSFCRSKRNS